MTPPPPSLLPFWTQVWVTFFSSFWIFESFLLIFRNYFWYLILWYLACVNWKESLERCRCYAIFPISVRILFKAQPTDTSKISWGDTLRALDFLFSLRGHAMPHNPIAMSSSIQLPSSGKKAKPHKATAISRVNFKLLQQRLTTCFLATAGKLQVYAVEIWEYPEIQKLHEKLHLLSLIRCISHQKLHQKSRLTEHNQSHVDPENALHPERNALAAGSVMLCEDLFKPLLKTAEGTAIPLRLPHARGKDHAEVAIPTLSSAIGTLAAEAWSQWWNLFRRPWRLDIELFLLAQNWCIKTNI